MASPMTGWITRNTTLRPCPAPRLPASREAVLAAVLHPTRLPTLPAVAAKVAEAASRPECDPGELVAILNQDPILCGELLRAVNSVRTGLAKPAGSIERAVLLVGMNRVRCLALGLSLPSIRPTSKYDPAAVGHSLSSVSGAILARELAVRMGYPAPDEDLFAGLIRDVGVLLLQQTFPAAWAELNRRAGDPLGNEQCGREREVFGTDHAEVGAEVLRTWGLPEDVVEPIRSHHHPERLAGTAYAARAELLWFTGLLTRLEAVVEHPAALDQILAVAEERFSLPRAELADFLDAVRPKIDEFAQLVNRDIGHCPNYSAILAAAEAELARLTALQG